MATDKIDHLISDAIKNGSKELYSANTDNLRKESNCYMSPKIILHKAENLEIEKTEIFGPIVSAFTFKTEEEVLQRANNTSYGLASYFYTENKDRIWRMSESLEYALASEVASFGGIKESGIGREGGRHGILEFLEEKFVVMG